MTVPAQHPLSLSDLLGIAREFQDRSDLEYQHTQTPSIHRALIHLIRMRQQARVALLIYAMSVILLIASFFSLNSGYFLFLGALALAGFLGVIQSWVTSENRFYRNLGNVVHKNNSFWRFVKFVPFYFWVQYKQDRVCRGLLTRAYIDSGWVCA